MVEENLPKPDTENKLLVTTVKISKKDMLVNASEDDTGGKDWVYSQIIDQTLDSELKEAMHLARKERNARLQKVKSDSNYVYSNPNPLYAGSEKYAYRSFKRPSGEVESAYANVQQLGIDATGLSLKYISSCLPLDKYLFPSSKDDTNTSTMMLVYNNRPYRNPDGEPGDGKLFVYDPKEISRVTMDVSEVEEKKVPTLKENLIGVVQIDWEE